MPQIEGFRIQNHRALRDVTLGKTRAQQHSEPLTPFTAVIGKNGTGRSTLFDAFGFVSDGPSIHPGGRAAIGRGGFPAAGAAKHEWAGRIAPRMTPEANLSPSFQTFRTALVDLAAAQEPSEGA